MKQITEEQRKAFAEDLKALQEKHGVALFVALQVAPLKEEETNEEK
jgi:thiamine monophosphate synthase